MTNILGFARNGAIEYQNIFDKQTTPFFILNFSRKKTKQVNPGN